MQINLSQEISLIFNTPIIQMAIPNHEALNEGLKRLILDREKKEPSAQISNRGGWHSTGNLLDWEAPEIETLRNAINDIVLKACTVPFANSTTKVSVSYAALGWANINRDGQYNMLHSHPRNHWAVVYYVATGEEDPPSRDNGALELRDPRPAAIHGRVAGYNYGRALLVKPTPGQMIAFPAWLEHSVLPFKGRGERISIAVNIEITKTDGLPSDQSRF